MRTFAMNKLVRDKIPQQMQDQAQAVVYRELTGRELQKALLEKLTEEVNEALIELDAPEALYEELADIQEVLDQLHENCKIDPEELKKIQSHKQEKRGGFERGYYVETVTLDDDNEWVGYYAGRPLHYQEVLQAEKS